MGYFLIHKGRKKTSYYAGDLTFEYTRKFAINFPTKGQALLARAKYLEHRKPYVDADLIESLIVIADSEE